MAPGLQKPDNITRVTAPGTGPGPEEPAASAGAPRERPGRHEGILDPVTAARRFRLRRYLPSDALAPFLEHHWIIRWDLRGEAPYTSEVLPHPSVNVAFTAERGWITGVTTGTYTYEVAGAGLIVGAMFRAGAFQAFRPAPVQGLTDRVIPATDVFPAADDAFRQRLVALLDDAAMVAAMERLLLADRPVPHPNAAIVAEAMAAMAHDPEVRTVAALAGRVHRSERRLQAVFRDAVGVSPKWVLMRQRHLAAAEAAARADDPDWAAIALELGYSDQSHFINDFRRLVGTPPDRYARSVRQASADGSDPA